MNAKQSCYLDKCVYLGIIIIIMHILSSDWLGLGVGLGLRDGDGDGDGKWIWEMRIEIIESQEMTVKSHGPPTTTTNPNF